MGLQPLLVALFHLGQETISHRDNPFLFPSTCTKGLSLVLEFLLELLLLAVDAAEPPVTGAVPEQVKLLKKSLATLESRVAGRPDPPLPFTVILMPSALANTVPRLTPT